MSDSPILFALPLSEAGPNWTHLNADHPETREWLEEMLKDVDGFAIDALLAEETRPRALELGRHILVILRGVNLHEGAEPEDMISIRILAGPDQIISTQKRQLKAVLDVRSKIEGGTGPTSAGELLCMIIARLFERMEPVLSDLDEATDDVEERLLEEADIKLREEIIDVRKKAIILRRYLAPQRDAISQLRNLDMDWLDQKDRRHLLESLDRITRYVEDLDAVRERAQIVKDELANALSDRLNRNTYILTVVAAIFLPLGFLTGLLGINVAGIPGADVPEAFWLFTAFLAALVAGMVVLFRHFRWF